eukprot:scaffold118712_cov51-Attheya_sp.AAC.4
MSECVICQEFLSAEPIGVTNPCGHPFHRECYSQWAAVCARKTSYEGFVSCPTCNASCEDFIHTFVDFHSQPPRTDTQDYGDDDSSLGSIESADLIDKDPIENNKKQTEQPNDWNLCFVPGGGDSEEPFEFSALYLLSVCKSILRTLPREERGEDSVEGTALMAEVTAHYKSTLQNRQDEITKTEDNVVSAFRSIWVMAKDVLSREVAHGEYRNLISDFKEACDEIFSSEIRYTLKMEYFEDVEHYEHVARRNIDHIIIRRASDMRNDSISNDADPESDEEVTCMGVSSTDHDVIAIDDEEDQPVTRRTKCSSSLRDTYNSSAECADALNEPAFLKMRRKALRFKRQLKAMKAQNKVRIESNQKLRTDHSELSEKVEELERNKKELESISSTLELRSRETQLNMVRLERTLSSKETLFHSLSNQLKDALEKTKATIARHHKELERAQKSGMIEVREMTESYSKMTEQNHEFQKEVNWLKLQVEKLEYQLQSKKRSMGNDDVGMASKGSQKVAKSMKSASGLAKAWKELETEQEKKEKLIRRQREKEKLQKQNTLPPAGKMSAHSSRLARAATKKTMSFQSQHNRILGSIDTSISSNNYDPFKSPDKQSSRNGNEKKTMYKRVDDERISSIDNAQNSDTWGDLYTNRNVTPAARATSTITEAMRAR